MQGTLWTPISHLDSPTSARSPVNEDWLSTMNNFTPKLPWKIRFAVNTAEGKFKAISRHLLSFWQWYSQKFQDKPTLPKETMHTWETETVNHSITDLSGINTQHHRDQVTFRPWPYLRTHSVAAGLLCYTREIIHWKWYFIQWLLGVQQHLVILYKLLNKLVSQECSPKEG